MWFTLSELPNCRGKKRVTGHSASQNVHNIVPYYIYYLACPFPESDEFSPGIPINLLAQELFFFNFSTLCI